MTEPICGPVYSGGVGLSSGGGLGHILGAGGGGGGVASEGGGRPPRPENWGEMSKLQRKNWKRQGGKVRLWS